MRLRKDGGLRHEEDSVFQHLVQLQPALLCLFLCLWLPVNPLSTPSSETPVSSKPHGNHSQSPTCSQTPISDRFNSLETRIPLPSEVPLNPLQPIQLAKLRHIQSPWALFVRSSARLMGGNSMARAPRAPRLVHKDPATGLLVLNEETLGSLRSIPGPVAVVGICGGARKGKSSLLTRIMESLGGGPPEQSFEASAEVDPCTKGLNISTVPLPVDDAKGRPFSLLFLDTEGIDATDQDRRDMAQVLTLCVLLSSVAILNEVGSISESTLDMLSLVGEVTKIVRAKASEDTQQGSGSPWAARGRPGGSFGMQLEDREVLEALQALSSFSPVLFWVLRDFSLRLRGSPTEYMEQALRDFPEDGRRGEAIAEKNRLRRCIRALFANRRCFTLVRPVADENLLQETHNLCLEDLRPQFQDGVKLLAEAVRGSATPPAISDAPLTGPLLASLCETYVAAMNGGAVPDIASVHQTALQDACARARRKALQLYVDHLGEPRWDKADRLLEIHTRGVKDALTSFTNGIMSFPEEVVAPAETKLRRKIQQAFEHFSAQVKARSAEHELKTVFENAKTGAVTGALGGCAIVATRAAIFGAGAVAAPVLLPTVVICAALGGLYWVGLRNSVSTKGPTTNE